VVRPLSELWPKGAPPLGDQLAARHGAVDGRGPVSGGLRMAWSEERQLRLALGEHG
jgi:hypothetical protein